ncbi:WD40 repeat domain-containing protein [Actinomadura oligospora]|uniref:WD40 repeat domain-containing protein n=1 Tax=Actinomadura oligospora TaxID=111804 RepID=UPI00047CC3E8|nr:hypothetical protein [Actinomadura oligospora]
MNSLDAALEAWPSDEAWSEVCRHVEGLAKPAVAAVAAKLRAWPARMRPMPDRWWAERQRGDHRPWHVLATHRPLSRARDFVISAVACPNDLSVLLIASGATGNNDLGRVQLFRPDPGGAHEDELLIATLEEDDTAVEAVFSPDGSRVTVGFADLGIGVGPAVYGVDGRRRHMLVTGESSGGDFAAGRVAQSGDGKLIAASNTETGAAIVADAATGTVLSHVDDAFGPVALDRTGRLLAHGCGSGLIALREAVSGELLSTLETRLTTLNALAFAPDTSGLLAVGDDHPTACLMEMEHDRLMGAAHVRSTNPDLRLDATTPVATYAARASWTFHGAHVFAADDEVAVLLECANGRVRWTSKAGLVAGSFTPDGRVFVASGLEDGVVDAWFLNSLRP